MSFIIENKVWLRLFGLVLFIISMLGPWTFDLINVPAQYPCDKPFVRLYGDFCGYPMSGFGTITWATTGFFDILDDLLKGQFAARIAELVFLTGVLVVVLPFFSHLLLIGNRNSRRLQTINLIVWGIACLPTLTMFILQSNRDQFLRFFYLLWGLWLYILVAIGAILFEIVVLRLHRKPSMDI